MLIIVVFIVVVVRSSFNREKEVTRDYHSYQALTCHSLISSERGSSIIHKLTDRRAFRATTRSIYLSNLKGRG